MYGDKCAFSHASEKEQCDASTQDSTNAAKVCVFYNSKSGCHNGSTCPVLHTDSSESAASILVVGKLRRKEDTSETLWHYFKRLGPVIHAKVKSDRAGSSRGFGFVAFADGESVERALVHGHPHWDVKRKDQMDEATTMHLDPTNIYFTHGRISFCFSNGTRVDQSIEKVFRGNMKFDEFPAMQVVSVGGKVFSLSNRRLFVARVLRNKNALKTVEVRLLDLEGARVQQKKEGNTKWERSYSTRNGGLWVEMPKGPCR
mmetsp:Transcript_101056/g.159797  ORF Transcript_101056/g.159797 Transcript_101056/m.159797 type:complete len:258 (+) Transcript_101056:236-1009(+)